MPRSRRAIRTSRKSARTRADWTYRPNLRDAVGALVDNLGTYEPTLTVLTPGVANAQARVLYDSHNYVSNMVQIAGATVRFPSPARAEGAKARIIMVEGMIVSAPSVWAVGSTFSLGLRFGIFEQDAGVGAFLIDPAYTMWAPSLNIPQNPAYWANDKKWQHERRAVEVFTENTVRFDRRFRFRVNRTIMPHECYGIYIESQTGSVNLSNQLWFRTLVADEGA